MTAEKNAMFQQQQVRGQMLQSCPLQVTTPTIWPSAVNTRNICSTPKTDLA
ncbi:hypothetical protein RDI58_022834 [Solanum bulbocastanum]|uniref:Uncharacterized protein n=1 Tax=Solanum bulbocastanum TaxID=147425 RepID=A0AAN8T2T6_SOLBU